LLAFLAPPEAVDLTSTELRVILPMSNAEADYTPVPEKGREGSIKVE